ncbi:MAG TPA: M48 family peptidase [Dehalococcoidia bacterium]|nr:M48 family peptidase [Dehalococcoidia bacterium]
MFLPRSMARYVLVHELCHIKQPNHGPNFWTLVEQHVKNSRSMGIKARKAGNFVPDWATPCSNLSSRN